MSACGNDLVTLHGRQRLGGTQQPQPSDRRHMPWRGAHSKAQLADRARLSRGEIRAVPEWLRILPQPAPLAGYTATLQARLATGRGPEHLESGNGQCPWQPHVKLAYAGARSRADDAGRRPAPQCCRIVACLEARDPRRLPRRQRLEFEYRHPPISGTGRADQAQVARAHGGEEHIVPGALRISGFVCGPPVLPILRAQDEVCGCERAVPVDQDAADRGRPTQVNLQPLARGERTAPSRRLIAVDRQRRLHGLLCIR